MMRPAAIACPCQRGFSLLELVLVTAILAVMAAIAAPHYGQAAARYRVERAARRVAADIELASCAARTAGAGRTMSFAPADGQYTLTGVAGLDDPTGDYRVDLGERPYEARIISADFGGDATLHFDGYGRADSDGTVELEAGATRRKVLFDRNSGRARVQ